jgi:hypothetical protein
MKKYLQPQKKNKFQISIKKRRNEEEKTIIEKMCNEEILSNLSQFLNESQKSLGKYEMIDNRIFCNSCYFFLKDTTSLTSEIY